MPDVDSLMQEWPTQFEELVKEVLLLIILLEIINYILDICTTCGY